MKKQNNLLGSISIYLVCQAASFQLLIQMQCVFNAQTHIPAQRGERKRQHMLLPPNGISKFFATILFICETCLLNFLDWSPTGLLEIWGMASPSLTSNNWFWRDHGLSSVTFQICPCHVAELGPLQMLPRHWCSQSIGLGPGQSLWS